MITQNRPQRSPLSSETINNLNTNYYEEKYFITIFFLSRYQYQR